MVFGHFIWKSCRYGCESELLVIPSAANALCSPLTAANAALFSLLHLTPGSVNQMRRKGRCPLLAAEILIVLFHLFIYCFFFSLSSSKISEADATLTTEDFGTGGLVGDGWRSIYITLPGSFCSPCLSISFCSFYLTLEAGQKGCAMREASWVFKERARSKGSGGCGSCDHRGVCGLIPAAFS